MARFNISLPPTLESQLRTDASERGKAISALIGEYVQEHYDAGEYLSYLDVWQRHVVALEDDELKEIALGGPDTSVGTVAGKLQAQIERCLPALENAITRIKKCEKGAASKEEQLQALRQKCDATQLELVRVKEQSTQQAASHGTIVNGLQHEIEITETRMKNLSEQVVDLKGQIHDLKADKENLQKQLELVTLRLPAPKEGFWSRVFGRKKKPEDNVQA